jgi:hypothetical protein
MALKNIRVVRIEPGGCGVGAVLSPKVAAIVLNESYRVQWLVGFSVLQSFKQRLKGMESILVSVLSAVLTRIMYARNRSKPPPGCVGLLKRPVSAKITPSVGIPGRVLSGMTSTSFAVKNKVWSRCKKQSLSKK